MKNLMKTSLKSLLKFSLILFFIPLLAQSPPQKISFQAVVRNSANTLISNTSVGMRISILQGSATGTEVYKETYSPNPITNINGLVTLAIGSGIPQFGTFSTIDWANGPYFIKTETDPAGGTNYTISGTTQMLSVPYALYAASSGNVGWGLTGNTGTNPTSNFIGTTDNQDVIFKRNGIFAGKIATSNTYFGHYYTYYMNSTGSNNAAFGAAALALNETGNSNTAIGADALFSNTTGMENTASGVAALAFNTLGNYNTAMGRDALRSNKANSRSTAMGYGAMYYADDRVAGRDTYNTAIGYQALSGSTTAANNTGQGNTAVGDQSLFSNTSGNSNIAIGMASQKYNTTGTNNVSSGLASLMYNTTGSNNIAIGHWAMYYNRGNSRSTAVGFEAMRNADDRISGVDTYNTALGYQALLGSATASNNTGLGNTAIGDQSLFSNTSGNSNSALGMASLKYNTTGMNNLSGGLASLMYNISGSNNVALGHWAMYYNRGNSRSTAVGFEAMKYADDQLTGRETYNTALGYQALLGSATATNNTGRYNTAMGDQSMYSNTTGFVNTASGISALKANTTGNYNTAIGGNALLSNTSGGFNTGLGTSAYFSTATLDNTICIGYNSGAIVNTSNRVEIGNSSVSVIAGQVGWSTYSDERIKDNISENVPGLSFITKLRPVTYNLNIHRQNAMMKDSGKNDADWKEKYAIEDIKMTGFLAQEVEDAARASGYDFSGVQAPANPDELYSIRYSDFVMPLVKAVQEQQVIIEQQNATIEQLIKRIEALEKK
jgi:trimeric autotransporter adhesin